MEFTTFDSIKIGLASPEQIRSWSYGAVERPETINYRTQKPEKGGLFCERIFGPTKDWECYCGKFKKIRFKGKICDRCGVEVTRAKVRRERMGHIELAAPVSHIWYFKGTPSRIGQVLEISQKRLEEVLYFTKYIVTDPGEPDPVHFGQYQTGLLKQQLLTEKEYYDTIEKYGADSFTAKMGAEAILDLLQEYSPDRYDNFRDYLIDEGKLTLDVQQREACRHCELEHHCNTCSFCADVTDEWKNNLDMVSESLKNELAQLNAKNNVRQSSQKSQKRVKLLKRLEIIEAFRLSGNKPEWMVMTVIPVIPPDIRPMVMLDGGRYATSDLNDLYRRVINRNNRLRRMLELDAPDIIVRNEKRMLQEAVDALIDNGRHGRPVTGPNNRALKSLSDMLKGKQGRFRQNLLGKRVDYSGRSVIVVGPELKMYQCGLPKEMALELFKPFVMKRLVETGVAGNIKSARKMVERVHPDVWDALEIVIKDHPVMLNRAPTLHRLSIQSFEPVLIEGEAIRLHPMVCTAFNADFDGDQMAVHVPLSVEAQLESRLMMLASNSIFSPASGKSIMTPTQDIALGIYYLTEVGQRDKLAGHDVGKDPINPEEHLPIFRDISEILLAREQGCLDNHSRLILLNPDYGRDTLLGDKNAKYIETTVGRVIFNEVWPAELGFVNKKINKSGLGDLILKCHKVAGHTRTVKVLDDLKDLGYAYACLAGVSMGLKDMIRPQAKDDLLNAAREEVAKVDQQLQIGIITEGERHNKIVDIWSTTTDKISDALYDAIDRNQTPENMNPRETNPVFMMVDSKARGSKQQIRQLAGMRGLMAKPSGEIIETPITASFREGLSILEYFISSHGARKGLADTALKTADAGYLTRKLVDVAQDVIITQDDCGTVNGIEITSSDAEGATPLKDRIIGRTALRDIFDPNDPEKIIVEANEEIDEEACKRIEAAGVDSVWIRSGLTCDAPHGMCAKCYGRDLSTGKQVAIGTAVGIVAAQSIGEPGTQLTMRTFHVGGTASAAVVTPEITVHHGGRIAFEDDLRTVRNDEGHLVVLNKNGSIAIYEDKGDSKSFDFANAKELERIPMQIGTTLLFEDGQTIKPEEILATWDPHSVPILSEYKGTVQFDDFIEGDTVETTADEATGKHDLVAIEPRSEAHPSITIRGIDPEDPKAGIVPLGSYPIPVGAHIMVEEGAEVAPGGILAKTPRQAAKSNDITGGLPRVAELFEARKPKDSADIAKIEGIVDFGPNTRGRRCVYVRDEFTGEQEEHLIQMGKHIIVTKGDKVRKGQQLTDGPIVPEDLLNICGPQELQRYLVDEVQQVYRIQGVEINDKHIEIIVRQMLRKVRITNPGDTDFLWGDQVMRQEFLETNEKMMNEGRRPAEAQPALLGITKASIETDSFISAASFQDTTRVLTDAATLGRHDELRGFKGNVILGHRIPGGTGFPTHSNIKLVPLVEPIEIEDQATPEAEDAERKLQEIKA